MIVEQNSVWPHQRLAWKAFSCHCLYTRWVVKMYDINKCAFSVVFCTHMFKVVVSRSLPLLCTNMTYVSVTFFVYLFLLISETPTFRFLMAIKLHSRAVRCLLCVDYSSTPIEAWRFSRGYGDWVWGVGRKHSSTNGNNDVSSPSKKKLQPGNTKNVPF